MMLNRRHGLRLGASAAHSLRPSSLAKTACLLKPGVHFGCAGYSGFNSASIPSGKGYGVWGMGYGGAAKNLDWFSSDPQASAVLGGAAESE